MIALAPTIPEFLAAAARAAVAEQDQRVLVVIQLDGGNDGINTVVPFGDEGYAKNRRRLRLTEDRLIKVGDGIGLHPSLGGFGKLWDSQRLAVVQGVGYPNPNRSHDVSMARAGRLRDGRSIKGYLRHDGWLRHVSIVETCRAAAVGCAVD